MSIETEEQTLPEFPTSSRELLVLLHKHYPARCIAYNESEISAHRYAGMRELIDELMVWQEEADETPSTGMH
tara:strand:- start:370 stop:585 length:216 start_codon:yes stop_codon:yes gene_type:complete